MELFRVITRLALRTSADAYKWSYVWYVMASDVAAAADVGRNDIWPALSPAHKTFTFCYEVYASDLVPNTTNYTVVGVDTIDQPGNIAPTDQLYRASTVVRMELNVAGSRPSRKYFRPALEEADVTNGVTLASGISTTIASAFTTLLGITSLRDESGNSFTSFTNKGLSDRRLGALARNDVPPSP